MSGGTEPWCGVGGPRQGPPRVLCGCPVFWTCPCPPVSPGALPQSYLHTFAYGSTTYLDLWSHLQKVGGGWLLPAAPPNPAPSPPLPWL